MRDDILFDNNVQRSKLVTRVAMFMARDTLVPGHDGRFSF